MATNEAATNFVDAEVRNRTDEFNDKLEVSTKNQNITTPLQQRVKHESSLKTGIFPPITIPEKNKSEENQNKTVTVQSTDPKTGKETDIYKERTLVYKNKHKIGSRKASESVITYNEPMYQSLVNSMFDKVKKTSHVKNKHNDSKQSKSLNSSPAKKTKTDLKRSLSFESVVKVKKKALELSDNEKHETHGSRSNQNKGIQKKKLLEEIEKCTKIVSDTKISKRNVKDEKKKAKVEQRKSEVRNSKTEHKKADVQKGDHSENIQTTQTTHRKNQNKQDPEEKKKNSTKTGSSDTKKKEKYTKTKSTIAQRRLKREASLNAVTFMNLLYVKEESALSKPVENTAKRSHSESDIQKVAKKQKRHSTPESLAAFEETINEVIQRIRAENTINEVVERVRAEVKGTEKVENQEIERQNSVDTNLVDEVFQKDKFDLIKIKASEAKSKKQAAIKPAKTPVVAVIDKEIGKRSPEEIAEKKRKANLARLKKAKEILKQGRIRTMKTGTDSLKEKELLNIKLAKLSVILKRKQKHLEKENKENKDGISKNGRVNKEVLPNKLKMGKKKGSEVDKPKRKKKVGNETCRSARTHMETPKRVVRPSSCQCCQSYYQSQGNSFWNNRAAMNRESYSQGPCPRGSYSQEPYHNNVVNRGAYSQEPCPGTSSELPSSPTLDVHPYSSPTHVPVVDNSPFVGQLMPAHFPQCNSCTCIHGAMMSAPCPQCAVGGVPMLTCHHQGFGSTYPVTFPHNHGTYSHCGCTYGASGSFHPSSSPIIHQTITAETPFLVHHSLPRQLPHESSRPLPVQLSHGERPPPISHQVSVGNLNSMHFSRVYSISQNELTTTTSVNTTIPTDHEIIDVGQENYSDIVTEYQRTSSSSDSVTGDGVKVQSSNTKSSDNKELEMKENEVKPRRLKSTEDKKNQSTTLKSKMSESSSGAKSKKDSVTSGKDSVKKTKIKEGKKEERKKERKKSGGNKENIQKSVSVHGWVWEGEPEVRTVTSIFDGKQVVRKCYKAIKHDDGDIIQVKDCVLVCAGAQYRDMPYVAKITNFWEDPDSGEMMMTLLWYYRPEHTEGGRQPYHKDCEVFAAKHRDESPVACIDDRCYVLTYNEYCRFMAEVARTKYDLPPRKKVVPDPEEPYPPRRIPPVDLDPENILLCRHVYDFKLKRVLKNPS